MNKIELKGVTKTFGNTKALDDVSLNFEEGKIYGLLGRNGAGKSTMLNIISNRIFLDGGTVTINGLKAAENDKAQEQLYLMSEKNYYSESLRVKDIFKWTKDFYKTFDIDKAFSLADVFKLDVKKKCNRLSTGYSSIFKIIIALCLDIPYIFLDEPVLGLDANHRDLFYKLLLEEYSENPRTFVISTHLIEEVSSIIEHVIMIKDGRIIEDKPVESILAAGYTVTGPAKAVDLFTVDKQVIGVDVLGGLKNAYVIGKLNKNNVPEELEISKLDLQKLFIQLTNA